jgi:hypothetical protein
MKNRKRKTSVVTVGGGDKRQHHTAARSKNHVAPADYAGSVGAVPG